MLDALRLDNCVEYRKLIAVRDAHKTGPLVHDQADDAHCEEERNYDDDDQIDGMRKQAASSTQRPDDRPTGNDPCRYWDRQGKEGDELTGDLNPKHIRLFWVFTTRRNKQRDYYDG